MTEIRIRSKGLDTLIKRFDRFPGVYKRKERATLQAMLYKIWELIPSYPVQRPTDYVRTGTLGRSLGVSEGGSKVGQPDIFSIRRFGSTVSQGRFGTNLDYAPYVIGDIASEQASIHRGHWWTLPQTVVALAARPLKRIAEIFMEELARYFERGV